LIWDRRNEGEERKWSRERGEERQERVMEGEHNKSTLYACMKISQ
jgi:hypothetical protein